MAFQDIVLLLLKGVLVASLPLLFVWARRGEDRYERLAWVVAFLTFDLVVFGGFTRLTDSGLGCPDWPGCFAKANPLAAAADIDRAQRAMPTGPVTMTKAWIEMIHRFLAMGVGLLITILAVWATRARRARAMGLTWSALALVVIQGLFGALTVTRRLEPAVVTTHLLLALSLLALLVWHALAVQAPVAATRPAALGAVRWLAPLGLAVLFLQVALGGWVSSNYAVLACTEFPMCQGRWIPPMDLASGFTLLRPLGRASDGSFLSFAALTAIHWVHRSFALVAAAVLLALAACAWRFAPIAKRARVLVVLIAAQFATGLANVLLGWPLLAAVLHNAGAAALVIVLVMLNYGVFLSRRAPIDGRADAGDPLLAH